MSQYIEGAPALGDIKQYSCWGCGWESDELDDFSGGDCWSCAFYGGGVEEPEPDDEAGYLAEVADHARTELAKCEAQFFLSHPHLSGADDC